MSQVEQWRKRRREVLREIAALEQIRRGSVVEQFVETTRKDGSPSRRGPYVLYSYKDKGRTVSRRIPDPERVARYREQIEGFRRFQELTAELLALGERISEQVLYEPGGVKKTSKRRSKSRKIPR